MTREQVLAMTDEELRVKAAELGGAKWYACKGIRILEFGRPFGWHEASAYEMRLPLGEAWDSNIPDYPNDIAAAWELVAAMDCDYVFRAITDDCRSEVARKWVVAFWPRSKRSAETFAFADTAPRAITRVFILAMEGDDES